jgi:hypothetical protein
MQEADHPVPDRPEDPNPVPMVNQARRAPARARANGQRRLPTPRFVDFLYKAKSSENQN